MPDPATVSRSLRAVEQYQEDWFLNNLIRDLLRGALRIPQFPRRPSRDWPIVQRLVFLDSVAKGYPVGSLLLWETSDLVPTVGQAGPFLMPHTVSHSSRLRDDTVLPSALPSSGPDDGAGDRSSTQMLLLDGIQRLVTLAGALVAPIPGRAADVDRRPWRFSWDTRDHRLVPDPAVDPAVDQVPAMRDPRLVPLTCLLSTLDYLQAIDRLRGSFGKDLTGAAEAVSEIDQVTRGFQSCRIPTVRVRASFEDALEIRERSNRDVLSGTPTIPRQADTGTGQR